jgi:transcriptional regulator GlxA family with amidase domain
LLMQMEDRHAFADDSAGVVEATPLGEDLACAAVRLLECLRSAEQASILGPGIVREIVYFALLGQSGANLRAFAAVNGQLGRIIRVLNRLHARYAEVVGVEALAREAGMSVSAFHAHFKALTALSPLQYVKAIRLHC